MHSKILHMKSIRMLNFSQFLHLLGGIEKSISHFLMPINAITISSCKIDISELKTSASVQSKKNWIG